MSQRYWDLLVEMSDLTAIIAKALYDRGGTAC